jgi:acyl-CoA synthetase (AMP-forming)/AMP-acid ligase II/thioesterase domain-containing protein
MRPGTLPSLLASRAQSHPRELALVAPGNVSYSFEALDREVRRLAEHLRSLGLGRGDRIAIATPTTPEAVALVLAAAAVGTAAPLPLDLPKNEARARLEGLRARALLAFEATAPGLVSAAGDAAVAVLTATPSAGESGIAINGPTLERVGRDDRPEADDAAVVLHTSGTTADAKRVPLSHAALIHSATHGSASLALTPRDRCLCFSPLFHIGGLVVAAVYPVVSGASTALPPRFDPDAFFDWLDELQPTWYWGVPAMHQAILQRAPAHPESVKRSRLRVVRSGAAPLAPNVIEGLQRTFRAPVLEVYGMTETGLVTSNPLPPRPQKPGSVGVAVGCELKVVGAAGAVLPAGAEGEVVVRGPAVMRGYDEDACSGGDTVFRDGFLRTGDLGRLDGDGYLTITGRAKEQINRGGHEISPRAVDEALLAHPAVVAAAAFPVPHPRLGEDLAAAIVLREGALADAAELRAFAARRLAPARVPGRIVFVDAIPLGPTGKPRRDRLARALGLDLRAAAVSGPRAVDAAEADMCRLWAEVLERPQVSPEDDFFDLGGDSVAAARIAARAGEALGLGLEPAALLEAPTPAALLLFARVRRGSTIVAPLVGEKDRPAFVFCVGAAPLLQLRRLARRLAHEHRVVALFASELQKRSGETSVEALADQAIAELARAGVAGPFRLAGFCFGAVLAFEIARRLRAADAPPPLLALFDPPPVPPRFQHRVVDRARARFAAWRGEKVWPGEPLRRALAAYKPAPHAVPARLFLTQECPPDGGEASELAWRKLLPALDVHRSTASHARLFAEPKVAELVGRD